MILFIKIMISSTISGKVLTIGPVPEGKGGVSTVVRYYRDYLFSKWNFIVEANDRKVKFPKLFDAISACVKLFAMLRTNNDIKIVHLHTAGKVSFPRSVVFMRIAKLMGRKVVMHMHSGTFPTYCAGKEKKVGKVLNKADALIVLGKKWSSYYRDTFGLKNIFVVPNIVPEIAGKFDISQRYNQGKIHALFLGHLVETKGIYDLLEALALVKDRLIDRFELHVGGKGDIGRFKSEVNRLGLEKMVTFEGWVSAEKKRDLLMKSSISILPSYFEGLPISLLEGMVFSHALIATDVGSIHEILDSSNGYIFAPGKIDEISDSVVTLVNDRTELRKMGEISSTKVRPYLPDSVARSLTILYEELLKE